MTALPSALRGKLAAVPVAALSTQLRHRGLLHCEIDGPRPQRPGPRMVGIARTIRYLPLREDLFATRAAGQNPQKRTFDTVHEGEVIVIDARGVRDAGTLGDILAERAHARGAAGIVTDGGVRDRDAVAAVGLPVYAASAHPAVLGRRHVPWEADVTVACGGATVQPGDVIVGDADGLVVVPRHLADEVADAALAQEAEDVWVAERIRDGAAIDGLFPMNAAWRARYEAARDAR